MPMQMNPHYWQLFASQQTDLLLLPPLTGTWLEFRSGAITRSCMILNPNKIKTLAVSTSRTVNLPHGRLVMSVVFISASPNLDILDVKLTACSPSKTVSVVLFLVSLREYSYSINCSLNKYTTDSIMTNSLCSTSAFILPNEYPGDGFVPMANDTVIIRYPLP